MHDNSKRNKDLGMCGGGDKIMLHYPKVRDSTMGDYLAMSESTFVKGQLME